ncbi:hypothetical protein BGZ57DRAFT_18143 [Hyaloscypha finlandica]|nr:hypothetical protein BGZ57DRAFT_18143 [Hyaloscypha finlandica]
MPFSAVASYHTSCDLFDQTYEELGSDFFDQFLTFSPLENETLEYPSLPDSTYLDTSDSHSGGTSLDSTDDEAKYSVIDNAWQGNSWAFTQDEASLHSAQGNAFYAELSGRAAVSDSELLSLEAINLDSPQIARCSHNSVPSSPSPSATLLERRKSRLVESLTKTVRKATGAIDRSLRSPIRKSTSSLAMKRSHSSETDNWSQKLALDATKFSFDFEKSIAPLTPPPSARISDLPDYLNSASTKQKPLNGFSDNSFLTKPIDRQTDYDTPLATPTLGADRTRSVSFQQPPSDFFPITPQPQNVSASWSQIPGSPKFTAYEAPALYPADVAAPVWWTNAATVPMAQPSPSSFHANPQRATKSLVTQLQNGLSYNGNELAFDPSKMASGLMIQMPGLAAQHSFVMGTSPMMRQGYFTASRSQPHCNAANRQRAHAPSRQPQSSSPMRKSRFGSSDYESPSPTFKVRKRKSPKNNKNSTPRAPSTLGAVDFVNFTPRDSRKILTGVAPSGSSKTKARREKEALEKRRKLSQAAMRAVREAGGDIESLVKQGLFV